LLRAELLGIDWRVSNRPARGSALQKHDPVETEAL
jgi:hypothetical protein